MYALGASLVAQTVKNLPVMLETQVQFLGQKDPLEEEMATHSSIFAWRIPWTVLPAVHGVTKSWTQLSHSQKNEEPKKLTHTV